MPRHALKTLTVVTLAALTAGSGTGHASEGRWALCGAPLLEPMPPGETPDSADRTINIGADRAQVTGSPPTYRFNGDVVVRQADQRVAGDRIRYDSGSGELRAAGGVQLRQPGLLVSAERARYWLDSHEGRFEGVGEYRLAAGHLQGSAERVIREGPMRSRYEGVTLSTCLPEEPLWTLRASRATIDQASRQGRARHAVLSIGRLPVFYSPYLQFPVGSERLTGLLAPTIGRSDDNGTSVSLPWYWNIAPNYDATITPTAYSRRGGRLDTQVRYLEATIQGTFNASILPDDSVFGDRRWAIDQDHQLTLGPSLRGRLRQQRVSDPFYTNDFSHGLDTRSASFLESEAGFSWTQPSASAAIDVQDWQTINTGIAARQRPYARAPRLQASYHPPSGWGPLAVRLDAEATRFSHPVADRTQGRRVDISPRIALPWRRLGYFVEPAVTWRWTDYDLEGRLPGEDATPTRSVPIYTLDAGIILERADSLFEGVQQTLEPRLFYRHAPTRDQSDLPAFDTGESVLTYSALFRTRAFTGLDRVEDGERLTAGLTTRFVDSVDGRTYLSASIGQIFYLTDRQVAADGDPDDERSRIVSELRANLPGGFSGDLDYRWDPDGARRDDDLRARLRWRGDGTQTLNLGLRRRRDDGETTLNQTELSFALPMTASTRLFGGLREDLDSDQTRERFIGFEHAGCCHAWRVLGNERIQRTRGAGDADLERSLMLEFELKGLGGIGDRIQSFLDAGIDGYNPRH